MRGALIQVMATVVDNDGHHHRLWLTPIEQPDGIPADRPLPTSTLVAAIRATADQLELMQDLRNIVNDAAE